MPKYVYFCKDCKCDFEIRHSLHETSINCINCGQGDSLERKPAGVFLINKTDKIDTKLQTGTVVKEAIEEARIDLRSDQNNLKNRVYKK